MPAAMTELFCEGVMGAIMKREELAFGYWFFVSTTTPSVPTMDMHPGILMWLTLTVIIWVSPSPQGADFYLH